MKFLFLSLIFLLPYLSKGQNLIPNGSFEDTLKCGDIGQPCDPGGWLYIKRASTNGYAHMIDGIEPYDGSRKLCFTVGSKYDKKRTYWETILLHKLEKGKHYKLTMHIHGWDDAPNLNDLGVWFVDSLFFFDRDTLLQPTDYIDILNAKVKEKKHGWFEIEREFEPERNFAYMVLGNFSPKDYQQVAQTRFSRSFYICDFVDDIRIEPVVKQPCLDCPRARDSIYLASQTLFFQQRYPVKVDTLRRVVANVIDTLELPNILFAVNSWELLDTASLMKYRSVFSEARIRNIVVAGYTDSTGSKEYNAGLAGKRASEVARQIKDRFGIDPAIIHSEGRGVSNKYADLVKNRRVDIYIYPGIE